MLTKEQSSTLRILDSLNKNKTCRAGTAELICALIEGKFIELSDKTGALCITNKGVFLLETLHVKRQRPRRVLRPRK